MLRHIMPLFLSGALLVQCAPAVSVSSVPLPEKASIQKAAEPVVHTQAQLDSSFPVWVAKAENPINFRLAGSLAGKWRQLINESTWGEFARSCTTAFMETGQVSLTLEYRDYVLIRAAVRDATLLPKLTTNQRKALQLARERVAALLRPGMSDFEKLLALHDDLVQSSQYETDGGSDVYDILSGGSGCCEAYSSALCVLCGLAGIPARVVTGSADGPHAWNLVQLGGAWYHVDATWDDPVMSGGRKQEISHAYFCLSDAEISRSHSWNRAAYPATACTSAYYYRQRGLYFETFDAYWRAALAAYRKGEKRFVGYLVNYGSDSAFRRNLQRAAAADTPRRLGWTGPKGKAGEVIMTFES